MKLFGLTKKYIYLQYIYIDITYVYFQYILHGMIFRLNCIKLTFMCLEMSRAPYFVNFTQMHQMMSSPGHFHPDSSGTNRSDATTFHSLIAEGMPRWIFTSTSLGQEDT